MPPRSSQPSTLHYGSSDAKRASLRAGRAAQSETNTTLTEMLKKAFVVLVASEMANYYGYIPSWVLLVEILLLVLSVLLFFVADSANRRHKLY